MKNNNLDSILYEKINKSCSVITQCYNTSEYYDNQGSLILQNMIVLGIVNFDGKTAYMMTSDLDSTYDYVTTKKYINYNEYIMEYSLFGSEKGKQSTSIVNYSQCSYNELFKPCGGLYPVNLEGIIPVDNPNNSNTFQAYTFDKQRACTITGYVSSLITINWICENMFEIVADITVKNTYGNEVNSKATTTLEISMCNKEDGCSCNCKCK